MEELRKRQKDEIKVLKSIYGENFTNLNDNGVSPNFKFSINLFPTKSESQYEHDKFYVQIDLVVEFSPDYPNESPIIKLVNEKGLSTDSVNSLKNQLNKKLEYEKGREIIHDLIVDIQEFLYRHNKPPAKSFFEQRLERTENFNISNIDSIKEFKKPNEDSLLNVEIENAVDEKKKLLQEERKKEKRERNLQSSERQKSISEDLITNLEKIFPFTIEFNQPKKFAVICYRLLDIDISNSLNAYLGFEDEGYELVKIYEWKIPLEKNKIYEKKRYELCLNKISKIFDEFKNLVKVSELNNSLVKYNGYKYYRDANKNLFVIQVCTEYVDGFTIDFFINNKRPSFAILDTTIRQYIKQILQALETLHRNNVIHRDLNSTCVYIEKKTSRLKIEKYSLFKKINNLNDIVLNESANEITGNVKSDIHQLGLLILSLATGQQIYDYHPQISPDLHPTFKNFISACLKDSDKIDCTFLKNHDYLNKESHNDTPENALEGLKFIQNRRTISENYNYDDDDLRKFTDYPVQSRLNTEFEVLGELGRGAFGEVLKVKNKLDSRLYAIKRIRINIKNKAFNKQITREIKLLSRLNHENVVRYYSTWMEQYEQEKQNQEIDKRSKSQSVSCEESIMKFQSDSEDESSIDSDSNAGLTRRNRMSNNDEKNLSLGELSQSTNSLTESHSSNSISFRCSESESDNMYSRFQPIDAMQQKKLAPKPKNKISDRSSDDSIIFVDSNTTNNEKLDEKGSNKMKKTSGKQNIKSRAKSQDNFAKRTEKNKLKRQYIYIQMEYCGGKTLKDLIEKGLPQNQEKVWCLFREILQGLNHIHEQGMIHRDLKPGNVLIDAKGHAKIGDFGLATTRLIISGSTDTNKNQISEGSFIGDEKNNKINYSKNFNLESGSQMGFGLDSIGSLSGAVGTALYVAPELFTPRFNYTQKVDIYSLGIMFYEMCFAFPTNMERIYVISNLRKKEIIFDESVDLHQHANQVHLIKQMLNHSPDERPTAKDLLLSDIVPKKADEIALDELIKYSFDHKQSTSYKKIIDAVFDQQASRVQDATFDLTNCKRQEFKNLQLQETLFSLLIRIFQKHGGYMISYPLLTPWNDIYKFERIFKVADSSGLVLCLPYNHRLPFARYLAKSGLTNVKRYYIGKVYTEKLKITSLHPREHMEASFDIVTSTPSDTLPEIELLTVVNDVINSTNELADQNYLLIVNHSFLLNAILNYCGITDLSIQKQIFQILAEYNQKLIKSMDASKDTRINYFKERLSKLNIRESEIDKVVNYFLKYGDPERVLSELKNLTKNESQWSKLTKDVLSQIKSIIINLNMIEFKLPIQLSTCFVLPSISNPCGYSGLTFQLLVKKKNNKSEYDILASGGRYDSMINQFKTNNFATQYAVGVSFDFEKMVNLMKEKPRFGVLRQEVAVCQIYNENQTITTTSPNNINKISNKRKSTSNDTNICTFAANTNYNHIIQQEIKNRLMLYKQFCSLNKSFNISTHIIHEKFMTVQEMDEYCKKHNIHSYTFINDTSVFYTGELFTSNLNQKPQIGGTSNVKFSNQQIFNSTENHSSVKIRSPVDKGYRIIEKNIHLNEFLSVTNQIINNMSSFNTLASNYLQTPIGSGFFSYPNIESLSAGNHSQSSLSLSSNSSSQGSSQSASMSYLDFLSSIFSSLGITSNSFQPHFSPSSNSSSSSCLSLTTTPSSTSLAQSSHSSSTLNYMSQVNFHMLQSSGSSSGSATQNRKRIEAQIVAKISNIFSLFNSRTRIEIIVTEMPESIMQTLATYIRLEMDEQYFQANWNQCVEQISNLKHRKQLLNYRLDELLRDLRYRKRSKVFVLFNTKSDQFKLIVAY